MRRRVACCSIEEATRMNVLLISSLQHVLSWVIEAAAAIEGIDIHVRDARHVEAGNALLRTRDDFHLVLIDLDTAGLGAVDVGRVWSARPGTNIAATRWLTSEVDLVACVKAGALGYFPKELSPRALAGAMSLVAQGMLWCPNLRQQLAPGGHGY